MFYERQPNDRNSKAEAIRRRRERVMREDEEEDMEPAKPAIQPKLESDSYRISQPGDAQEKEADMIARKVVDGGDANISQLSATNSSVQSKSEGDALHAPEGLQRQLDSSKGSGQSLPENVQQDIGGKIGVDLGNVKIHTGSNAHEMADSVNAKAFTHGQDIYFKDGNYDPGSRDGKELLAHEVVHTVQNGEGVGRKVWRKDEGPGWYITVKTTWFLGAPVYASASKTSKVLQRLQQGEQVRAKKDSGTIQDWNEVVIDLGDSEVVGYLWKDNVDTIAYRLFPVEVKGPEIQYTEQSSERYTKDELDLFGDMFRFSISIDRIKQVYTRAHMSQESTVLSINFEYTGDGFSDKRVAKVYLNDIAQMGIGQGPEPMLPFDFRWQFKFSKLTEAYSDDPVIKLYYIDVLSKYVTQPATTQEYEQSQNKHSWDRTRIWIADKAEDEFSWSPAAKRHKIGASSSKTGFLINPDTPGAFGDAPIGISAAALWGDMITNQVMVVPYLAVPSNEKNGKPGETGVRGEEFEVIQANLSLKLALDALADFMPPFGEFITVPMVGFFTGKNSIGKLPGTHLSDGFDGIISLDEWDKLWRTIVADEEKYRSGKVSGSKEKKEFEKAGYNASLLVNTLQYCRPILTKIVAYGSTGDNALRDKLENLSTSIKIDCEYAVFYSYTDPGKAEGYLAQIESKYNFYKRIVSALYLQQGGIVDTNLEAAKIAYNDMPDGNGNVRHLIEIGLNTIPGKYEQTAEAFFSGATNEAPEMPVAISSEHVVGLIDLLGNVKFLNGVIRQADSAAASKWLDTFYDIESVIGLNYQSYLSDPLNVNIEELNELLTTQLGRFYEIVNNPDYMTAIDVDMKWAEYQRSRDRFIVEVGINVIAFVVMRRVGISITALPFLARLFTAEAIAAFAFVGETVAFTATSQILQLAFFGKTNQSFLKELGMNALMFGFLKGAASGFDKTFIRFVGATGKEVSAARNLLSYKSGMLASQLGAMQVFGELVALREKGKGTTWAESFEIFFNNVLFVLLLNAVDKGCFRNKMAEALGIQNDVRFQARLDAISKLRNTISENVAAKDLVSMIENAKDLAVLEDKLYQDLLKLPADQRPANYEQKYKEYVENYKKALAEIQLQLAELGIDLNLMVGKTKMFRPVGRGMVEFAGPEALAEIEKAYQKAGKELVDLGDGLWKGTDPITGEVIYYIDGGVRAVQEYTSGGKITVQEMIEAAGFDWEAVRKEFGSSGSLKDNLLLGDAWTKENWRPGKEVPEKYRIELLSGAEARSLINKAKAQQAPVTADLIAIADQTGGKMEGLDNSVKSEESLSRKIRDRVKPENTKRLGLEKAVKQSATKINDALRFTMVFEPGSYVDAFNKVKNLLIEKGYKFEKIYNGWTSSGGTYYGLNATFETPSGFKFELQFHTPETFKIKMETHELYERARDVSISETERKSIEKKQIDAYKDVIMPEGVENIKN